MIIQSLKINNQYVSFKHNTLIYSKRNSVGKTTLVRLILFSLGFKIPSTKGLDFNKLITYIHVQRNNINYFIRRSNEILTLYKNNQYIQTFTIKNNSELLSIIFGITNTQIIKNILGVFYFDQDKGWTLLNRGKVIGNIQFNVEEYLEGINNINLGKYRHSISRLTNNIKFYNNVKRLLKLNNTNTQSLESFNFLKTNKNISLNNILFTIRLKINKTKGQINQIHEVKRNNKDLIRIIEECHLVVRSKDGQRIEVSKNNLEGYKLNKSLINTKLIHLKWLLDKEQKKRDFIEDSLKQIDLLHHKSQIDKFKFLISNIDMTPESVKDISKKLNKKRKELRDKVQNIIKYSDAMTELYKIMSSFSKQLNITKYIDKNVNFVLTHNLKRYSGAILHLIVFSYRISLVKLLEKKCSIVLPIIIDSPATGELDPNNLTKMFKIIKKYFPKHQVIVSSINNFKKINIHWQKIINIKNSLFTSLNKIK